MKNEILYTDENAVPWVRGADSRVALECEASSPWQLLTGEFVYVRVVIPWPWVDPKQIRRGRHDARFLVFARSEVVQRAFTALGWSPDGEGSIASYAGVEMAPVEQWDIQRVGDVDATALLAALTDGDISDMLRGH